MLSGRRLAHTVWRARWREEVAAVVARAGNSRRPERGVFVQSRRAKPNRSVKPTKPTKFSNPLKIKLSDGPIVAGVGILQGFVGFVAAADISQCVSRPALVLIMTLIDIPGLT